MMRDDYIKSVKRLVLKIGTSSIVDEKGLIQETFLNEIVEAIFYLKAQKIDVCVVCSGAVGAGLHQLNCTEKPNRIPQIQALAAVGQIFIMSAFSKAFEKKNLEVGQILLTHDVLKDRSRYLHARNTVNALFELNVVPIINENDSVAIDEIKFGDNDTLSALVTNLIEADLLILLSDIDGLMTQDPKENPQAERIKIVDEITEEVMNLAGPSKSMTGTGGLITKLQAAQIVTSCGEAMIVANSKTPQILQKLFDLKDYGTFFKPQRSSLASRKRWLAFNLDVTGRIRVDTGAYRAIKEKGKSLLPSGILSFKGKFDEMDLIEIENEEGFAFARGLVNYRYEDIAKIKGLNSNEIEAVLGVCSYESVVHRDNLVLMNGEVS